MKVVISDLHLMDRSHRYLFNTEKERIFSLLCEQVIDSDGELILAGDIFDLTGLSPCKNGMREFFREAVPPSQLDRALMEQHCSVRTLEELLTSIKSAFPRFFESLNKVANESRVIYIPGNHDCVFLQNESKEVFAKSLEVSEAAIRWCEKFETKHLLVRHGNEFDPSNSTVNGCQNPGFVFTSALYQAVIPALKMLGIDDYVLDAIPAVRPEEATIEGLHHYLGENRLRKLLLALAGLLQRNGYFQGLSRIPAWFLSHSVPLISNVLRAGVTEARIRALLPNEEQLKNTARSGALGLAVRSQSDRVIVMGHTHELDMQERYVNLGTWIDHLTGLHPAEINQPQISIPVLLVNGDDTVALYDAVTLKKWLEDCPVLWKCKINGG